MQTARPASNPAAQPPGGQPITGALKTAITLAELLQRVENSGQRIGASQYRRLVRHLAQLLDGLTLEGGLDTLLSTFPAAAALYENARYDHAGLCRSPLDASLASELQAHAVIVKARADLPTA